MGAWWLDAEEDSITITLRQGAWRVLAIGCGASSSSVFSEHEDAPGFGYDAPRIFLDACLEMTTRLLPLLFVLTALLSACGSGGGGTGGATPSAPATTTLTVTPVLGMVRNAMVRVLDLDGHVLVQGAVNAQGKAELQLPVGGKPVVVELVGASGADYYDEGMEQWRALPAGVVLHAVRLADEPAVTVTVLSEIVYRRALFLGGGHLDATVIAQSRQDIQGWLGSLQVSPAVPPDFSLLSPVQVVDGTQLIDASREDGWHATLLAGISRYAFLKRSMDDPDCLENPDCFPLEGAMDGLMTDVAQDRLTPSEMSELIDYIILNSYAYNGRRQPAVENASVDAMTEIAAAFAGGYTLSCDGVADPLRLRVLPSGEVVLKGSMGSAWWGTGSLQQANSLVAREYQVTAAGAGFTLDGMHVEVGLVDGVPQVGMAHDSYLAVNPDGSVILAHQGAVYGCTGMPVRLRTLPVFTQAMRGGSYACSGGAAAVVTDEQAALTGVFSLSSIPLSSFTTYRHAVIPQLNASLDALEIGQTFSYQGSVRMFGMDLPITVNGARSDSDAGRVLQSFNASVPGLLNYACGYNGG